MQRHRWLCGLLMGWLAGTSAGWACSVPVFRYGLERWPADPYEVTIFQRGELTDASKEIVTALTQAGEQSANLIVTTVDVAKAIPEPAQALWASNQTVALPAMVVQYPQISRLPHSCWAGPLTVAVARGLVDSPVRRELARRLLKGDSAVWLLLEGADKAANDKAAGILDKELAKLQQEMQLPEPDPNDPRISGEVPLKIQFSTIRVSRAEPAETMFAAMLLGTDGNFAKETGPIVFPVFGRGRALIAFTLENLKPENIAEAAYFLCGACSCEVKAQNPGVDLLVAADWEGGLMGRVVQDPPLPPLVSLSALASAAAAPAPVQPTPVATATESTGHPLLRNVVVVVVVGLGLIALASFLVKSRR